MATKGASNYRSGIRAASRGLWVGALDYYDAYEAMSATIRMGIRTAWHEGAAKCGINPNELSPEEQNQLRRRTFDEMNRIDAFLVWIEGRTKALGGKLGPVHARAEVWVNRYNDVRNEAKVMACGDRKLKWVFNALGVTKNPCNTCQYKLNGKVKRASYWRDRDVRPQNPPNNKLDCEGWGCLCDLVPTDDPLSRGPLPNLP